MSKRKKIVLILIFGILALSILIVGCDQGEIVTLNFDASVDENFGTISSITVTIYNYGGGMVTDLTLVHSSTDYNLTDHSVFTIIYQMSDIKIAGDTSVDVTITMDQISEYLIKNSVQLQLFEGYIGVILHMDAFLKGDSEGKTGFIHSDARNQFYIVCFDENEPNDISDTAAALPVYPSENSIFTGSDIDWFSFAANGSQIYNITTEALISYYPSDTYIELYDNPADIPIQSSSNGTGFDNIYGWTAPSTGTYYLKITDENSEIGTYRLLVE